MEASSASFAAIGVRNQVTVLVPSALDAALAIAREDVRALDDACSRFRADSELARLNRAGDSALSPLLRDALRAALETAAWTGGLVDPTVGAAMRAIGYDRDFELVLRRGPARSIERRPASGWDAVRVTADGGAVKLPRGCELDLGASAKAFAADRIATRIHAATGTAALVSLGGDIAVAGDPPPGGWPVLVTDDSRRLDARGPVVGLRTGGLATSSTSVRRWREGEVERHHIVDPRTGLPARTPWRTVSVAAANCLRANAAATAAIVLGREAPRWLAHRGLDARLLTHGGDVLVTGGWPAETARDADAQTARTTQDPASPFPPSLQEAAA